VHSEAKKKPALHVKRDVITNASARVANASKDETVNTKSDDVATIDASSICVWDPDSAMDTTATVTPGAAASRAEALRSAVVPSDAMPSVTTTTIVLPPR